MNSGRQNMINKNSGITIGDSILKQNVQLQEYAGDGPEYRQMLYMGDRIKLGKLVNKGGKNWVSVTAKDGTTGFIPGDTKVFTVKRAQLLQTTTNVYSDPAINSPVKFYLGKNSNVTMVDIVDNMISIVDDSGHQGYIPGQTQIKAVAYVSKAQGKKNMLYGALWFVGGSIATIVGYSSASSGGGTYLVFWGAIIFGLIQFFQGLGQYSKGN
jgi:hypothetical protein